jgi:hypothetical protein
MSLEISPKFRLKFLISPITFISTGTYPTRASELTAIPFDPGFSGGLSLFA